MQTELHSRGVEYQCTGAASSQAVVLMCECDSADMLCLTFGLQR